MILLQGLVDTASSNARPGNARDGRGATAEEATNTILNEKAVSVITRVESKLTGKDFGPEVLGVTQQVDELIKQASNHVNLAQCYIGWCPFW